MKNKTITYDKFLGIDNCSDPSSLITRDREGTRVRLLQGTNIDVFNDYRLGRSTGYSLFKSGSFGSVWSNNEICLAVCNGDLIRIFPDASTSVLLYDVGATEMAYESVFDSTEENIYFTNGIIIGKVRKEAAALLSPTILNEVKEVKLPLPPGNMIKFFQSSIHVINDKTAYLSDFTNREIYDTRWGFRQFETTITMYEPVNDGIYISDSKRVYFAKRIPATNEITATQEFQLEVISKYPAIPGTSQKLTNVQSPSGRQLNQAIVWRTNDWFFVGGDGGVVEPILLNVYSPPNGQVGSSLFKDVPGLRQYISIVK